MRIFLNRNFHRFARKEGISDELLLEAVDRATRGLVDADLGGGVLKQRLARENEGRSGGYRSIILYRSGEMAFFVFGFAKNEKSNISKRELDDLRKLSAIYCSLNAERLQALISSEGLNEIESR